MKPTPGEEAGQDRLGDFGLDYFTELTVEYIRDMREARLTDMQAQSDRNVGWFRFDPEAVRATGGPSGGSPSGTTGGAAEGEKAALGEAIPEGLSGGVEMSVSIYPGSPAVTVGLDTRIPYHAFQQNAAWILRTCADFGVGIDLDVKEDSGETWTFLFLRIFWAGYNFEVLTAACDDLAQCRKALEVRLPINEGHERK